MKHVHYKSKGNRVGLEDHINDYWEIDAEGYVQRSIQILPDSTVLKYDQNHAADAHGALPEGRITSDHLEDAAYGEVTPITLAEFEDKWNQSAINVT